MAVKLQRNKQGINNCFFDVYFGIQLPIDFMKIHCARCIVIMVAFSSLSCTSDEEDQSVTISDQSFNVIENAEMDTYIGELVTAFNGKKQLHFVMNEGNVDDAFRIDHNGTISVNNPVAIDYEINPQFTLDVSAFNGNARDDAIVEIFVRDIPSPVFNKLFFTITEDAKNGDVVGTIEVTSLATDEIQLEFASGNENAVFSLGNNDELILEKRDELNFTDRYLHLGIIAEAATEVSDGVIAVDLISKDDQSVLLDAMKYAIRDGVIEDFGINDLHYNYDFTIVNQEVQIIDGEIDINNLNVGVFAELYSPDTVFLTGTYVFMDKDDPEFSIEIIDRKYFTHALLFLDKDNNHQLNDLTEMYFAEGGSIRIDKIGHQYRMSCELTLENEKSLTGSYESDFLYFDKRN